MSNIYLKIFLLMFTMIILLLTDRPRDTGGRTGNST
jgi:hypothetical protein